MVFLSEQNSKSSPFRADSKNRLPTPTFSDSRRYVCKRGGNPRRMPGAGRISVGSARRPGGPPDFYACKMTGGGMPPRPPKPCRKPGCRNLATDAGGYCPEHKHLADEALALRRSAQDKVRGNAAKRGYDAHWQRVRHLQLRRDPLCAICARAAEVVHHRDGNPRNNASGNLMSLCRECHERLHGRLRTSHLGPKPC